jgi:hypothetical protein
MTSFLDEVQARALVGSAERVLAKHDQKATYIRSAAARLLELAAQLFGSALRGEPANIRLRCAQVKMRAVRVDVRPDGKLARQARAEAERFQLLESWAQADQVRARGAFRGACLPVYD